MKQQEKLEACPACNSADLKPHLEVKDHSVSKEVFKLTKCANCSLIFTNPRPVESELGAYYESENYISHTNRKSGLFEMAYHMARNYMLKKKWNLINSHGKIESLLDIGAGTGAFLNYASQHIKSLSGVEPSDKARAIALENTALKIYSSLEDHPAASLDCITLWHVMEHLPNLQTDIKTISKLLKKDGILVVAVPNIDSYDAEIYGSSWAALDVPRHLYHFSKTSMVKLMEGNNFKLIDIKNMPLDSFYVSMLSENYQEKPGSKIRGAKIGLKSNLKGKKHNNQSSLIYLFKK